MNLELAHSHRLGQTVQTTWEKMLSRYMIGPHDSERSRVYKELCENGESKLSDDSGTLYIKVIK